MKKAIKHIALLALAFIAPVLSFAHVGYVIEEDVLRQNLGRDFSFVFSALSDPKNILLIIATLLVFLVVYYLAHKNYFLHNEILDINKRASSYSEYIPWILRLSLGIALIGAGTAGVLISPLLSVSGFALVQTAIGFMLLAGFLLPFATTVAIGLYFIAVLQNGYILGNLEFISGALVLLLIDDTRPGLDDLLGLPRIVIAKAKEWAPFILRMGIGGAMLYLALFEKILNPHISQMVVRDYNLTSAIPVSEPMWILAVGLIELVVGLFLLIGFKTRLTSMIAFLVLCVTFFYFKEEIFSHVTLFGILSALFITGGGKWSIDQKYGTAPDGEVEMRKI